MKNISIRKKKDRKKYEKNCSKTHYVRQDIILNIIIKCCVK